MRMRSGRHPAHQTARKRRGGGRLPAHSGCDRAWAALAAKAQRDRTIARLERDSPRDRRLIRVGGADDCQVRDRAQRGKLLHGLMGGPSSPRAILSWVNTCTTCSPISAASRIGGRM